ncbi:probably inactive leucine-rich repeat receptor-like protein kinase At5g48380 isoform X2 [Lathyrus oleraceus]|uniref:probably inactive leucine-rich repeat receptor-like protein kinase At5g48380 isoform X2 n=1 Tax=Pisum sativum TaxID=3888 RepID=UPI0021CF9376|nr:probably inactive leucine-rich repeat receptor-like protein kinase At5g48380 isoform X2 [Pisum sativum]
MLTLNTVFRLSKLKHFANNFDSIISCLLAKNRKNKNLQRKKTGKKSKLPDHNSKQKLKKVCKKDQILPVGLLEKRIQINKVGRLSYRINYTKICHATKDFSRDNVIGVGVIGIMYKATLPNGCFLAVTRLNDSQLSIKRFELEIMLLGQYSHRNIVPLVGFCIEEQNERVLVYQYMPNGKLSDWLNDDTTKLGWSRVIKIALGVARGLCCFHHSLHMVHLSISSECILLGNNFEPKISNVGEAIMNNDVNKNIGFEKKDVYDFGCLLFELIKGKKFGQVSDCLSDTSVPFTTYTYPNPMNLLEDHFGFYDVMDETLNKIEFEDEVSSLLSVACDCVHPFFEQRPTMLEVYCKMGKIWERDEICEDLDIVTSTTSNVTNSFGCD